MNHPRVPIDKIEALSKRLVFKFHVPEGTTCTFCHAFLPGTDDRLFYLASGFSACISVKNYHQETGEVIAKEDALYNAYQKLWELEGYALFKDLNT